MVFTIVFASLIVVWLADLPSSNTLRRVDALPQAALLRHVPCPKCTCSPPSSNGNDPLALCIATREFNSAEWLPEWIEYHNALGVQRIFIVDDCSSDDGQTKSVLDYYQSLGMVDPFYNPSSNPCNTPDRTPKEELLVNFAFHSAKDAGCQWVTVIDVDEFLTPSDRINETYGIQEVLRDFRMPFMKLPWWIMLHDGQEQKPTNSLAIETYTNGYLQLLHSKTVALTSIVKHWGLSLYPTKVNARDSWMLPRIAAHQLGSEYAKRARINSSTFDVPNSPLYVRHYMYRSLEEFMRGRGSHRVTSNGEHNPWANNTGAWREGATPPVTGRRRVVGHELHGEFIAKMSAAVRERLLTRDLPPITHFTIPSKRPS